MPTPRYMLIGYPFKHETIKAKALLKNANIDFVFVYISESEYKTNNISGIKKLPAVRLVEHPGIPIADGIDEIKAWVKAA